MRLVACEVDLLCAMHHRFVTTSDDGCHQLRKGAVKHGKAHGMYGTKTRQLVASQFEPQMGHSLSVFMTFCKATVEKEHGERCFNIMPTDTASNAVELQKAVSP
jgi:hypothetical protein